jgi:sugar (glycoside-pentoside-hexuronide) transporter
MIYTLTDVPFWALTTAMSRDSGERTRLITMARIFAMAGTVLPTAFVPALADMLSPKDLAVGYRGAVGIIVVVAVPLMTLAFFGTRERVPASPDRLTLKTTFRLLKTNRPLQILVIAGLLNSITLIAQSGTIYFVTHNLGNAALMTVAGGVGALAVTVGIGLTPLFTKSYGKVAVMIGSTILRSVFAFILFFVGYENLVVTGVFYFVIYALIGPTIVLQSAMIADSVDYAEWRTGERAEGVIFSFQTFLAKITAGIGGLLLGIILSGIGYQAGVDQTPFALRGLFATMVLSPAVGGILLIIPFFFYPMSDKRHAEIVREIKARSET